MAGCTSSLVRRQAIGANATLLPKPMQAQLSRLFDDAPQVPYDEIAAVLRSEFGRSPSGPDGLFESFEETAVASASIAQVHRARLKSGELVAVKIQKPSVAKQMEPDLLVFKAVMWAYERVFELPALFVVDFISDHLRQELDFVNEARNSQLTADFISQDPKLSERVHVPHVYDAYSTRRVLTAEWIDGVRLSNRQAVLTLMGEKGRLPEASQPSFVETSPSSNSPHPLRGGVKWVMQTMVELFGAQIFRWGWVHCDPHPGNFLLRPHPAKPSDPQLVLLDHGLYVRLGSEFRRQYAELWKSCLAVDTEKIKQVATEWGIGAPDLFASATLLRPMHFVTRSSAETGEAVPKLSQYELSIKMKERLKSFLTDTDKMPKELIFIGRNMRMVQGNNQMFGSPVNRVKITAFSAADSLPRLQGLSPRQRIHEYFRQMTFYVVMYAIDTLFWTTRLKNWLLSWRSSYVRLRGFEDELDAQMANMLKSEYGVDVDPAMFEA